METTITQTQIIELRNEIDNANLPRNNYKNRPSGCPMFHRMDENLQRHFTKEEMQKAFVLGLVGNNGRKGSVIENCLSSLHQR